MCVCVCARPRVRASMCVIVPICTGILFKEITSTDRERYTEKYSRISEILIDEIADKFIDP